MKPFFVSRLHRWWAARKARHRRLAQFQLFSALPDEIRNDIARNSLIEAFDDGSGFGRRNRRVLQAGLRHG